VTMKDSMMEIGSEILIDLNSAIVTETNLLKEIGLGLMMVTLMVIMMETVMD